MGKLSVKDRGLVTPKPKRRLRSSSDKVLKPGALAKLRYNKASTAKSCTDIAKKRAAVLDSDIVLRGIAESPLMLSPVDLCKQKYVLRTPRGPRVEEFETELRLETLPTLDPCKQNNLLSTPKTPQVEDSDTESRLESLPMDLLVNILCHLQHDQLRAVFHVSSRVRKAVLLARQFHFNYTTPDRSRQEMLRTMTPRPMEHWPFVGKGDRKSIHIPTPHTPKAPRQGHRPPPRLKFTEMRQIAAVLFQEPAFPPRCMIPSVLSRPLFKSMASNRVLFYEDELCQAVAQNKLR